MEKDGKKDPGQAHNNRMGRWKATVLERHSNRKNRYWRRSGYELSGGVVEARFSVGGAAFSMRAQVRYTSKSRRRTPRRIIEG